MNKSSPEEIRARFDHDVDRFSNLETGQTATVDAPLVLELITAAAANVTPHATALLDVGCGAGNYTLKLLERLPHLHVTLLDLSRPMLDRAVTRIRQVTPNPVADLHGDLRNIELGQNRFDIILAATVLHHLREDAEWESVFAKLHATLRPGGALWIADLVEHLLPEVQALMWDRYGAYLAQVKDVGYREQVFANIQEEDSPRSLLYQIDLLRRVGFRRVDILHKNSCFAAFGALKSSG